MNKEPLGLPRGSVRSIIALTFLAFLGVYVWRNLTPPDWFLALVGSIMGYYFGVRNSVKGGEE